MKRPLVLTLLLLTLAATAVASGLDPVLTSAGVLYTVGTNDEDRTLVVTARYNSTKQSMVVPATVDGVLDTDGRLVYDRSTETLYVVWRRGESSSEIVFQSLSRSGQWSPVTTLANAPGFRQSGLRVVLTRTISAQNEAVTLIHAIWWKEAQAQLSAEYGLAALSGQTVHSTYAADLEQLSGIRSMLDTGATSEDGLAVRPELVPTYPPFAISPAINAVDVVYGSKDKKTVTRIRVEPRQPRPDARLWIPVGRNGTRTPYTRVHNAMSGQVETHISGERVVIYSATSQFRYALFDQGKWSPVRSLVLDATITPAEIVSQLRRNLEEQQ